MPAAVHFRAPPDGGETAANVTAGVPSTLRNPLLPLLAAAAVVTLPAGGGAARANPLAAAKLYVDREAPAWLEWQHLQRTGQSRKASLVWKIAREPGPRWVGKFTKPSLARKLGPYLDQAARAGAVPVITVLRAEAISCAPGYLAGGAAEDARTREWYSDLARVIGRHRVVIAFEPDSLGTIDCQARHRRDDRYRLLRFGVTTLSALPNATVYVEAGASDWEPARKMARKLRRVGIAHARGFMLNATHTDWTAANLRYGRRLSRLVGDKHFVVNTAQNGRGPVHYRRGNRRIVVWCDPGLRGLGLPPTTDTGHPLADAFLWVNRPGYAQSCTGQAIEWFLPEALELARFATDWRHAPKGTRFGHFKRYPLRAFNIPR